MYIYANRRACECDGAVLSNFWQRTSGPSQAKLGGTPLSRQAKGVARRSTTPFAALRDVPHQSSFVFASQGEAARLLNLGQVYWATY